MMIGEARQTGKFLHHFQEKALFWLTKSDLEEALWGPITPLF